jgi:hypothetical protein
MKPTLLALITTGLLAMNIAHAQGPVFGVKGGLTLSNLYAGDADDKNGRVGFNLGVLGRTDPGQPLGFQVELLYTTKGETFTYDDFLIDQEFKLHLGYVDLPVMVSIRAGEVLELQGGLYAGLLLSSNLSSSGDLGTSSVDLDKAHFTPFDYGLVGGIALNAEAMQVGARYNYGLRKLAASDEAQALLGDAKNSYAQIYVAFGFGR